MAHVAPYPRRRAPAPPPRPGWALEEEFREEIDEDDPDDPANEEDDLEEGDEDRDDLALCTARDFKDLARRCAAGVAARRETL